MVLRLALAVLFLLAAPPGWVTAFAHGQLDSFEPDDIYGAPSAAWLLPAPPGGDETDLALGVLVAE